MQNFCGILPAELYANVFLDLRLIWYGSFCSCLKFFCQKMHYITLHWTDFLAFLMNQRCGFQNWASGDLNFQVYSFTPTSENLLCPIISSPLLFWWRRWPTKAFLWLKNSIFHHNRGVNRYFLQKYGHWLTKASVNIGFGKGNGKHHTV